MMKTEGSTALERFRRAQSSDTAGFEAARAELVSGRKVGHWMWYIFPQLKGLGASDISRFYALRDRDEATAYLSDHVLGTRLAEMTGLVDAKLKRGIRLEILFDGSIDARKLVSSLTLFELAARRGAAEAFPFRREDFNRHCAAVLGTADREGFERCFYTVSHASV